MGSKTVEQTWTDREPVLGREIVWVWAFTRVQIPTKRRTFGAYVSAQCRFYARAGLRWRCDLLLLLHYFGHLFSTRDIRPAGWSWSVLRPERPVTSWSLNIHRRWASDTRYSDSATARYTPCTRRRTADTSPRCCTRHGTGSLGPGSMGHLGHLSRPGHRVIILTRRETRVFPVFDKKPKIKI